MKSKRVQPASGISVCRRDGHEAPMACGECGTAASTLEAALGPDEALDRAGPHEEIGLTIGRMVLNNLLRRNENPLLVEPRVPPVFRILAVSGFHSEFRFDDVRNAATIQRLVATRRAQV